MHMGDLSTFGSLLWSLSSVVCSSPSRGHLYPLLSLFLGILFFEVIVNGIVFPYLSQFVHCWCIESLLIFVNWFRILLHCWSCLQCLGVFGWSFLGLWCIGLCDLKIGILWLFLYLFVFLLFLLLALLLWLGIPGLCWIGVRRRDIPVSFLTLREMVSVFPH
jgi:hypothetical protein